MTRKRKISIMYSLFVLLQGCVRYIFASLFCMYKREYLWNKEKCYLLHFESSFRSWDNQISTFQVLNVMASSNSQEWNILLNNLRSKCSLVMKFGQFMQYYKNKFFYQKIIRKMRPGNQFQALFNFQGFLRKKESGEVSVLIWTNCDSPANKYLMYVACFKNFNLQ